LADGTVGGEADRVGAALEQVAHRVAAGRVGDKRQRAMIGRRVSGTVLPGLDLGTGAAGGTGAIQQGEVAGPGGAGLQQQSRHVCPHVLGGGQRCQNYRKTLSNLWCRITGGIPRLVGGDCAGP